MNKWIFRSATFPIMKSTSYLFGLVILFTLLASCTDKKELIGKWDDNIRLSTKYAEFNANTDSVTIKTQGDWWWVASISFNDSTYHYYNSEDIDLESNVYSIKEDCFVVERRDKNTLFIMLEENLTGKERSMQLVIEAGDYFDYVNIKQTAE